MVGSASPSVVRTKSSRTRTSGMGGTLPQGAVNKAFSAVIGVKVISARVVAMTAPSSTEITSAQKIAQNLEASAQILRQTAANIQTLLNLGRATCSEIKAYNLWAFSLYHCQRGMLTAVRAAGQTDVPELPPYPTLFQWRGVAGENAGRIDCNTTQQGLTGALRDAMRDEHPIYLSTREVTTVTQDQQTLPNTGPSYGQLVQMAEGQLGGWFIPLLIAGAVVAIGAAAFYSLSKYWKEQTIQENTTERARVQQVAFREYTAARVGCYGDCMARGYTQEQCTDVCKQLIDKPDIKIDAARAPGDTNNLITGGAVLAVTAVGGFIWWLRRRNQQHSMMVP